MNTQPADMIAHFSFDFKTTLNDFACLLCLMAVVGRTSKIDLVDLTLNDLSAPRGDIPGFGHVFDVMMFTELNIGQTIHNRSRNRRTVTTVIETTC